MQYMQTISGVCGCELLNMGSAGPLALVLYSTNISTVSYKYCSSLNSPCTCPIQHWETRKDLRCFNFHLLLELWVTIPHEDSPAPCTYCLVCAHAGDGCRWTKNFALCVCVCMRACVRVHVCECVCTSIITIIYLAIPACTLLSIA